MNSSMNIRRAFMIIFALCYLLNSLFGIPYVSFVYSFLLIIIIIQAVPTLPRANMTISILLFLIGGIVLLLNGASPPQWLDSIAKNAGIVTLFITVPMIGIPFFYEDYQKELKHVAQKHMNNVLPFCFLTSVITHIFGAIILVGSVSVVYDLLKENARLYKSDEAFIASMLQGQAASGLWSPVWASMAIITLNLDIPWLSILPFGLFLATIYIICSMLWLYFQTNKNPEYYGIQEHDKNIKINWKYIYTLVLLVLSPILSIMVLNIATPWKIVTIIPVVAITCPLIIAIIQNKLKQYQAGLKNYFDITLFRVKSEVVLLAAAGFLGGSLEIAGVGNVIPRLIPAWLNDFPFFTIASLILIMIIISMIGIHPVITGSALVSAIDPISIGLPNLIFGLTMLTGWSLGILLSPFSAINLITSGLTGMTPWHISFRINGPFGLTIASILTITITLLFYLH